MVDAEELLRGLSREQREAVVAPAPLLIVAAAGSGKTRVLTHRIAYQIATHTVQSTRSVAISFTRAAAWEVSRRLYRLIDEAPPPCGTFHSHALGLVRDGLGMLGRSMPRLIGDPWVLVGESKQKLGESRRRAVAAEIDRLRAHGLNATDLSEHRDFVGIADPDELISIMVAMERAKAREHLIDLTDVVRIATELVARNDGVGEALRLQARWVYIDEFQDVNPLQLRFIERWMGGDLSGLTVVGDPNQSIYGWNGSDPRLMAQLHERVPTLTRVALSVNYRSTASLVDAANPVIDPGLDLHVRAQRQGGQSPQLLEAATGRAEAEMAAHKIQELHYRGVSYASMAVLARTIRQLRTVEEVFGRLEIPHSVLGMTPLASAPAVIDLMRTARTERLAISEICDMIEEALIVSTPESRTNQRLLLEVATELRRQDPAADYGALDELLRGLQVKGIEAVSITTFHRAKGLQWHHVHLIGIGDRSYPSRRGLAQSLLDEERRLLYVAMTRATDSLTISWSKPSTRPSEMLTHLPFGEVMTTPASIATGGAPSLATQLDRWRVIVAKERKLPAYLILSDADLRRLTRQRPNDRHALVTTLTTPLLMESPQLIDRLMAELTK